MPVLADQLIFDDIEFGWNAREHDVQMTPTKPLVALIGRL